MQIQVRSFGSVTSTMDVAIEAAEAGAPEGLVIVADQQTSGRGRRGRSWSSPPGSGLYLSCVLRPEVGATPMIALITLAAGVAVRHSLGRAAGLVPDLKWPNDLVIGQRKLAGILAEGLALNSPAQAIVLGIGINLKAAAHPPEIAGRAISIEEARGHPVDRAVLQEDVLAGLSDLYGRLRRGQVDDILREWRDAAPSAVGSRVEWDTPLGSRSGTTQGIDEDGALLVRTQDSVERIIGGELRWL